jgi:phosphatidylserine/phosphatidylglycerophosphate/cardiolipin synthase-like enzyme
VATIEKAKKSVDIVIFRCDRAEIEAGLKAAATRGVSVSALIAQEALKLPGAEEGVDIRVIGALGRQSHHLQVRPLGGFRLHTRAIVRDRREAFVGSQSLRKAELDSRREVGVIVRQSEVLSGLINTCEADWGVNESAEQ